MRSDQIRRLIGLAAALLPLILIGSGLLDLGTLLRDPASTRGPLWLRNVFPLDTIRVMPSLRLIFAFALILTGFHLGTRKKRAQRLAVGLSFASSAVWLLAGQPLFAAASATIALLLIALRGYFRVGSAPADLGLALRRAAAALTIACAYGTVGFWLLKPRHFGQTFHWGEAISRTLRAMLLLGDAGIEPRTAHAAWFLESLFLVSAGMFLYCGLTLFRPVAYRYLDSLYDRERASAIASRHGKSALDFFKLWPDKSFFFSSSGRSFLAYRVAKHFALVLGDPVGPEEEMASTVREFMDLCNARGWRVAFHQVRGEMLSVYQKLGFRGLKIGDEAIVDLQRFTLEGSAMKEFRNTVNRLRRLGYQVRRIEPEEAAALFPQLQQVSDEWLSLPGHRERRFTLGNFTREYLSATTLYAAFDQQNGVCAFLNLVPSYEPDLATVDLMRRRRDSVSGLMDFLFALTFLDLKERGYKRFSLGMAPSSDEKVVRFAMQRAPSVFRADSLRRFKAKYADSWEPRYSVYRTRLDLPRFALTLHRVTEERPKFGRAA